MYDEKRPCIPPELHGTEEITAPRLDLRRVKSRDAEMLYELACDPAVKRFFQGYNFSSVKEAADAIAAWREQYADETFLCWCAQLAETGEPIGHIAASVTPSLSAAELEYAISPCHRGHGYGKEAVSAVISYLHGIGIHRVSARINVENSASAATAEAAGMELEGVLRDALADRDKNFYDVAVYSHIE